MFYVSSKMCFITVERAEAPRSTNRGKKMTIGGRRLGREAAI